MQLSLIHISLNIKPVMGSTDEGSIQQLGQARGMKRALTKMVAVSYTHLDVYKRQNRYCLK